MRLVEEPAAFIAVFVAMKRTYRSPLFVVMALSATAGNAIAQSSNKPATLGGSGRYVFGQINEYNADQYMLDTATGRLWRLVDTADGTGSVLELVPYALPDGNTQPTPPDAEAFRTPDSATAEPPLPSPAEDGR